MSRPDMRTGSSSQNPIAPAGLRRLEASLSPESHDPIMRPRLIHRADCPKPQTLESTTPTPTHIWPRGRRKLPEVTWEVGGRLGTRSWDGAESWDGRWAGGTELPPGAVPVLKSVTSQTQGAGGEREATLDQQQGHGPVA